MTGCLLMVALEVAVDGVLVVASGVCSLKLRG